MRRLILNVHLVLALIAGAFMAVLGVTGSILAFEPELDRWFHADLSYVKPGERTLSLVEIGDAVSRKYAGEPIVAFLPSQSPRFPTEVLMSRGVVSVNQYTGEILGVRTRGQTLLGFVRALHVRLASGDWGRNFLKWSAVAMLLSLGSGLYLWWPLKRVRIRGPWLSGRFWFDLHNAIGIFSLLPLLALAATGTVIGFEDQLASLLDRLTGSSAVQASRTLIQPEHESAAYELTPDQAVAIARARLPGATPYRVQMPRYGGVYVVALTYADNRIASEHNAFSIDPWSGKIISADLSTDFTARERILAVNRAVHTGDLFGMPSRIVVALAGILLPVQAVGGLVIWLLRRKIARPD